MFTIENTLRTVELANGERRAQLKSASPRYTVADPEALGDQLRAAGCDVTTFQKLMTKRNHAPNPWLAGLSVQLPLKRMDLVGEGNETYVLTARILLRHDGNGAVRLEPGAMRLACENQFYAPARFSLSHVGREIVDFLDNPMPWVEATAAYGRELVERLGELKNAALDGRPLLNAIAIAKPRIGAWVFRAAQTYEPTLWGAMQALTGTHRTGPEKLAALCLADGWGELRLGRVPACLEAALAN